MYIIPCHYHLPRVIFSLFFLQQVIFASVVAVALAAPQYGYSAPDPSANYVAPSASTRDAVQVIEIVPILRDERVHEGGRYSFDIETGNGIRASEAGSPDGPEGAVVAAGGYS